tara:strand:- start:628 stop:915 length:288 start_codon:yes stop_codon:yes gene_type:complete
MKNLNRVNLYSRVSRNSPYQRFPFVPSTPVESCVDLTQRLISAIADNLSRSAEGPRLLEQLHGAPLCIAVAGRRLQALTEDSPEGHNYELADCYG